MTPDVLYEEVIELEERVVLQQDRCCLATKCPVAMGTTGEKVKGDLEFSLKSFVLMS